MTKQDTHVTKKPSFHKQFDLVYKSKTTPFFPVCFMGVGYTKNFKKTFDVSIISPKYAKDNQNHKKSIQNAAKRTAKNH